VDIFVDKIVRNIDFSTNFPTKKVELARGGHFKFQIEVEAQALKTTFLRVCDAQQRFASFPLHTVS